VRRPRSTWWTGTGCARSWAAAPRSLHITLNQKHACLSAWYIRDSIDVEGQECVVRLLEQRIEEGEWVLTYVHPPSRRRCSGAPHPA
jgi:hypothetical protein